MADKTSKLGAEFNRHPEQGRMVITARDAVVLRAVHEIRRAIQPEPEYIPEAPVANNAVEAGTSYKVPPGLVERAIDGLDAGAVDTGALETDKAAQIEAAREAVRNA